MLPLVYSLKQDQIQSQYNGELANTAIQEFLSTIPNGRSQFTQAAARMAAALYNEACQQAGKTHFLDKTPRYYMIIPELAEFFPEARFIFLLRNPLAVLASIFEKNVKEHWVILGRHREDLLTAPGKLLEGAARLGERSLTMHYEELVDQPASELERVCRFLQIEFFPKMIEYGASKKPIGSMGDTTQINAHQKPVTTRKSRWLNLADNIQTRHYALAYLDALGPDLLGELGYDFQVLKTQLSAAPSSGNFNKPSWNDLMNPDEAMQKRLFYLEFALLEHKRITQALRRRFVRRSG